MIWYWFWWALNILIWIVLIAWVWKKENKWKGVADTVKKGYPGIGILISCDGSVIFKGDSEALYYSLRYGGYGKGKWVDPVTFSPVVTPLKESGLDMRIWWDKP